MRNALGEPVVSQDGKFRVTGFDDKSVRIERLCTGKIISINEASPKENENGTIFYVATVEADLNGNKHVGSAIIWHNQLKSPKLPEGAFAPGATVGLAIQVKSKYAGNTSIEWVSENKTKLLEYPSSLIGDTPIDYTSKVKGVNLSPQKLNDKTSEITNIKDKTLNIETVNVSNNGIKKEKEHGCGATFFIMILSFCIVGLILSPLSFLGFLLYPLLVGGGLLLGGFIMNITK